MAKIGFVENLLQEMRCRLEVARHHLFFLPLQYFQLIYIVYWYFFKIVAVKEDSCIRLIPFSSVFFIQVLRFEKVFKVFKKYL